MLEPLAAAGLVIVMVVFMLIQREDLRNRLIRLVGFGRLTFTTKALEETGQRISRYLLMQSIVQLVAAVARHRPYRLARRLHSAATIAGGTAFLIPR